MLQIIKALVLTGQGPDRVTLFTDQPSSFSVYSDNLALSFEADAGTGETYVWNQFGIKAEIVNRGAKLRHSA